MLGVARDEGLRRSVHSQVSDNAIYDTVRRRTLRLQLSSLDPIC